MATAVDEHAHPTTFDELLALPTHERLAVEIGRRNLLCAAGLPRAENLDVEEYIATLDSWAERVRFQTERHLSAFHRDPSSFDNSEPLWRMLVLTRVLEDEFGIHYNPARIDGDPDWADSRDLFINGLLGPARTGTCPSLPVLVVAVGRRIGYPLKLVHSPGHVFSRWDGAAHENPSWRKRLNVEVHGRGLNTYPDKRYHNEPVKWNRELRQSEQRRGKKRLFLRSLEPAEEFAADVAQRGHCLEAMSNYDQAWLLYSLAWRHAPHDERYGHSAQEVHKKKLAAILEPWGMTPQEYTALVHRRLKGGDFQFPWEAAGRDLDAESTVACRPGAAMVMARPLASTVAAVAARYGIRQPAPEQPVMAHSDSHWTIDTQ